jgi:hypothetical protein
MRDRFHGFLMRALEKKYPAMKHVFSNVSGNVGGRQQVTIA